MLTSSLDEIRSAADEDPRCLVALSGGKDSLAVLDLACQCFDLVECFHMWLVPGLECESGPVTAAAARHGVKVHEIPHWHLGRLFKAGTFSPRRRQLHLKRPVRHGQMR